MIHADKNYLKATLSMGMLQIQTALIDLYVGNLQSLGTIAALIAALAMKGFLETDWPIKEYVDTPTTEYLYYIFNLLSFTLAAYATSQAMFVTIKGPSTALQGDNAEVVLKVADKIRDGRLYCLKLSFMSITFFFFASILLYYTKVPNGLAIYMSLVFLSGYVLFVYESYKCFKIFNPEKSDYTKLDTEDKDQSADGSVPNKKSREQLESDTLTKARGVIWMRQSLSKGGNITPCYGVLQKSDFDVYRSEDEFINHEDPINKNPFHLQQYRVVTDYKEFPSVGVVGGTTIRTNIMFQTDFSVATLTTSPVELKEAFKKFRFVLVPVVSSELSPLDTAELMAEDQESYDLWIRALSTVINAHRELHKLPTLESTMRNHDIESIVKAANIKKASST